MNPDVKLLEAVNGLAGKSPTFDAIVVGITQSTLPKGLLLMSVLWWVWTRKDGRFVHRDALLVQSLIGLAVCIIIGRVLQLAVPGRRRPVDDPGLDLFIIPQAHPEAFHDVNSFPSDHAIVFAAVSTLIWTQSRFLGAVAYLWTAIIILLPRVYVGLHYPSDIVAGALIGTVVVFIVMRMRPPLVLSNFAGFMQERHPGVLSAFMFFISMQLAVLFEDIRRAASGLAKIFVSY